MTIVAASLTGLPFNHKSWDLPVERVHHVGAPHHWREAMDGETEAEFSTRLAAELEAKIIEEGPETVATFIAEPVMGAGGVIVPPQGYFEAIMPVLHRHDILCISDEVICGFGRTGEWFGAQTLGMEPTSMSVAKQMTAGFVPLSATMINREMTDVIEAHSSELGVLGHGFTYGGHPVGCAVGVKTLEIYERIGAPGLVKALAPSFAAHLDRLAGHPLVGEARHLGLMGALEFTPDGTPAPFKAPGKVGAYAASQLLERGVIARAIGDSLAFCPPMIITADELDAMFEPVEAALDAALHWARAEGHCV